MARKDARLISKSLKPWVRYLDRLADQPNQKTKTELHGVLSKAFGTSQLFSHPITGRLKASGYVESHTTSSARISRWVGFISYGRGLDYHRFEFDADPQRTRPDWLIHPSHDPYEGLEIYYAEIDLVLGKVMV